MFEPSIVVTHDVEAYQDGTKRGVTSFQLASWGIIHRVTGGPYDNLWYFNLANAQAEFDRRVWEAEEVAGNVD